MKLYHGTNSENRDSILINGLQPGNNTHGGTHGVFDEPKLFFTEYLHIAQKYGDLILIVDIPEEKLWKTTDRDGVCYYTYNTVHDFTTEDDYDELPLPDFIGDLE